MLKGTVMTNYQALFLDIDGTILQKDHTIQESTITAIAQAKTKGIKVFLATGRPLHEVNQIANVVKVDSFIGYNGAYADIAGEVLVNEAISQEVLDHYYHISRQLGHEMVLYTTTLNLFTSLDAPAVKTFISYFNLTKNDIYSPEQADPILGITILGAKEEELQHYQTKEPITFSQVNVEGLHNNFDVIRENVNKGSAIKKVLHTLHISFDQAIAFGDGMNDKQMLQLVGESFAMGNAHPDLFAFAKHHTSSVSDHGIYNGLKQLHIVS